MPASNQTEKDAAKAKPLMEEADIGSGEKSPGQLETEQMIRGIPPLPRNGSDAGNASAEQQPEPGHDKPAPDDLPPPGAIKSGMAAGGGQP